MADDARRFTNVSLRSRVSLSGCLAVYDTALLCIVDEHGTIFGESYFPTPDAATTGLRIQAREAACRHVAGWQ